MSTVKYKSKPKCWVTYRSVLDMYRGFIERFESIGVGNKTEFKTVVTQRMIDLTRERLYELQTGKSIRKLKLRSGLK